MEGASHQQTQQAMQEFFSDSTFSQVFSTASIPPKETTNVASSSFLPAADDSKIHENEIAVEKPEGTISVLNAGQIDILLAQNKDLNSKFNALVRLLADKDEVIKRQELQAKKQSIYSYSFLLYLRACIENEAARVVDAETLLRAVFGSGSSSNVNHFLDCLVQTLLMWMPTNVKAYSGMRNAGVESQVNTSVWFLALLTRERVHGMRIAEKHVVFVWRMLSFLNWPVTTGMIENRTCGDSVLAKVAEVQNGLLSIMQHLVMHNSCCQILLNNILVSQQNSAEFARQNPQGTGRKYLTPLLVRLLIRFVMLSDFTLAVELSLTTLTAMCMQIDAESKRQSLVVNQDSEARESAHSSAYTDIKLLHQLFRLEMCTLDPVKIHRLNEQWDHVKGIKTALAALSNVMCMPNPLSALVNVQQQNGDPDSEEWQKYEFECDAEKVVVADDVLEPLDTDSLAQPAHCLVRQPVAVSFADELQQDPVAILEPDQNVHDHVDMSAQPISISDSTAARQAPPSTLYTAPRTVSYSKPAAGPSNVVQPYADDSARKRLFYDDNDANAAIVAPGAAKKPALAVPMLPAGAGITGKKGTVKPTDPAALKDGRVQIPLTYRKPAERIMFDSRSPANTSISFKNGGGKIPSQKERGSQDIRNFLPVLNSPQPSPQQVIQARMKRNAAAAFEQQHAVSTAATYGSRNNNFNSAGKIYGYPMVRGTRSRPGKYRNKPRGKQTSPMHIRIGPRTGSSNLQSPSAAEYSPAADDNEYDEENNDDDNYQQDLTQYNNFARRLRDESYSLADDERSVGSVNEISNDDVMHVEDVQIADAHPARVAHVQSNLSPSHRSDLHHAVNNISPSSYIDLSDFSTQDALRNMAAFKLTGGQPDKMSMPLYTVDDTTTAQYQAQLVNDLAASLTTQQLAESSSPFVQPVAAPGAFNAARNQSSSSKQNFVLPQASSTMKNREKAREIAAKRRGGDDANAAPSGDTGMVCGVNISDATGGGTRAAPQGHEPLARIPVNYEVHTVSGDGVDDDGSRSSDIIPLDAVYVPTARNLAQKPMGVGGPVVDDSDDAIQVLLETFSTQDTLRNMKNISNTRGQLNSRR